MTMLLEDEVGTVLAEVQRHLTTLRRLPDDVVLEVAGQDLDLADSNSCLCGWALRGVMAKLQHTAIRKWNVERTENYASRHGGVCSALVNKVGGTYQDWHEIFIGVVGKEETIAAVEHAWTLRVDEAVERAAYAALSQS